MRLLIAIIFLTTAMFAEANQARSKTYTQTVRGKVVDADSKSTLIGVNVIIAGSDPIKGTTTDVNGNFRLEDVAVGRINLLATYLGYEDKAISNVIVQSGKETVLNIEMTESLEVIEEIIVTGGRKKGEALNEMAIMSSHTFTVDETKRYAGSLDDPSRMVSAFAGVTNDPQGLNEIVVRGNSPKGIQWRLEGIDIPNPNHFADESTTGGPINALSSNMLATSDFYTGAFAPEYGNVLSGIFDMKLRNGNNEKHEFTLGVGALGVDAAAEGPFKENYNGSYLFNYRYSSLGLLNDLNIADFGGVPKYQDLTFKVNLPTKKAGRFSVFALGGKSRIKLEMFNPDDVVQEYAEYESQFGVLGLNHTYRLNKNSFIKTSLSASNNGSGYDEFRLKDSGNYNKEVIQTTNKNTLAASLKYSNKFNAKHRLIFGADYKHYFYDMHDKHVSKYHQKWKTNIDLNNDAGMFQSYASWKYRIAEPLTMVGGIHYINFLLNNSQSLEPRLALQYDINKRSSLNAGFGMHSIKESIITYQVQVYDDDWNASTPNTNLDLTKARHYVLSYNQRLLKNLNAKIEVYYQDLYNVPVENDPSSNFSTLNSNHGYIAKGLVNKGKGRNYGTEFTLERFFDDDYYFLFTTSLYKSEYKALTNKWLNTHYDGNYIFNFLIGKEFIIGDEDKENILNINARATYTGGRKILHLDLEESREKGYSIYQTENAYEDKLDDIFNLNLTASLKINRQNTTHEFLIDFYNALNNQARVGEDYNPFTQEMEYYKQLSMMPNIMYRFHF
ncbi:MAG: TonB-dependent receptor [Prolixibacteraceae bacterium]|nr:TonB-dependent receptor [Prolixibacteraceae bacterium]